MFRWEKRKKIKVCWVCVKLRGCLDSFFWSLNFYHSSLKMPCLFSTIIHFPSFNIFHTICGPHTCQLVQLFFFSSTQKPEPSERRKEKRKRKKKPRRRRLNLVKEERKKKKSKSTVEL